MAEVVSVALGGTKTPVSRKDFMFDMRRREDALGESRMMGSRRRVGFFWRFEMRGVGWGCAVGAGKEGLVEVRERRKVEAVLR